MGSVILNQMRAGIAALIYFDKDIGYITRQVKTDNGMGQLVSTGETTEHTLECRVSYENSSVSGSRQWEGGLLMNESPFFLGYWNANIEQGDILVWRDKKYEVGIVTHRHVGGDVTCTQAKLTEVQ